MNSNSSLLSFRLDKNLVYLGNTPDLVLLLLLLYTAQCEVIIIMCDFEGNNTNNQLSECFCYQSTEWSNYYF